MRKIVLLAFSAALAIAPVALPQLVAPAFAEGIYQGGSCAPGIVGARQTIGRLGIDPNCYGGNRGGGYQRGGAFYHGHGHRQVTGGYWVPQPYTIKMCHQYEIIGNIKRYIRHYPCP